MRTFRLPLPIDPADVDRAVAMFTTAVAAATERACEEALQAGDRGVLVRRADDGTVTVEVSPAVPYGQIHHRR